MGVTSANIDSSRSHAVLQILLYKPTENSLYSKINFIDLAGSEKASETLNQSR